MKTPVSFRLLLTLALLCCGRGGSALGETRHGPNVNPSNLAVLTEWERQMGRPADVVGDNLSAEYWHVYHEARNFPLRDNRGRKSAIANALTRWTNAFDGDPATLPNEGFPWNHVEPRKRLADYTIELAVPMFPKYMVDSKTGEMIDSRLLAERWQIWDEESPHYQEAKAAFQNLAIALNEAGLGHARLRLGWEFTGGWFPWGLTLRDAPKGAIPGTPEQFKNCWKFIHETMEGMNPDFTWVWCGDLGFDESTLSPQAAFPVYPNLKTSKADDVVVLVDYVSADIYDADGESYWQEVPEVGWWSERPNTQKAAVRKFVQKMVEGDGANPANPRSTVGLRYYKNLAEAYDLPFVVSEFGPMATFYLKPGSETAELAFSGHFGGDDNPFFMATLLDWFEENGVESVSLFEFYGDGVDHSLLGGFWEKWKERPPYRVYGNPDSPFYEEFGTVDNLFHPRAAKVYRERVTRGRR